MTMGDTFGPAERRPQLRGVSGWLLFLCISLMIFPPLRFGLFLWAALTAPNSDFLRKTFADSYGLAVVPILIVPSFYLLAIVGGVLLYREQRLGLRLVQTFLGLQVFFNILGLLGGETIALLGALPSAAWLAYLFRSERVRNTFFRDISGDAAEVFR